MVDFQLREEQRALQSLAREFAEKEIKPVAAELDAKPDPADCFSWDLVRKMSKLGFRTLPVPTEYGGGGVESCLTNCIVAEELSVGDPSITAVVLLSGLKVAHLLFDEAVPPEQAEKYMRQYCEDEDCLVSTAICEPDAGADNVVPYDAPDAGMRLRVEEDGDYYILNGTKHFIMNGNIAKVNFIWGRTDPTKGVTEGVTAFIVPHDAKGLSFGRVHDKSGARLMLNSEMIFENVRVHESDVLGEKNKGLRLFREMLHRGDNIVNGNRLVGTARAIFEASVEHSKQRVQGGKPIIEHQAVAMILADMFMEIEAARSFLWKAAWLADNRDRFLFDAKYASMSSTLAHEMAFRISGKALEIFGGYGIMKEYPIEKYMRDAASYLHADGGVHVKRIKTAALL